MFTPAAVGGVNSWNQDYRTVGFGNYGYGVYTQDVEVYRNALTGRVNIERDVDFVPLGGNRLGGYSSFPAAYHQHYYN